MVALLWVMMMNWEIPHHVVETADIGVVQRRVHLVQQAEGGRLDQEDREDQRHGGQRLFTPRQQGHILQLLARRLDDDVDAGLQQVGGSVITI